MACYNDPIAIYNQSSGKGNNLSGASRAFAIWPSDSQRHAHADSDIENAQIYIRACAHTQVRSINRSYDVYAMWCLSSKASAALYLVAAGWHFFVWGWRWLLMLPNCLLLSHSSKSHSLFSANGAHQLMVTCVVLCSTHISAWENDE